MRRCVRRLEYDTYRHYNPSLTGWLLHLHDHVEAGQQVIIVEQETDGQPTWNINMNTGVGADRAR